jgi:glyoxylase-like metal-dependent hydrolase (beta-lactamase superfamily II)
MFAHPEFKGKPVIGGKDCEAVTKTPANGETFHIGEGIEVKALYTPCHTQDSICWFMTDKASGERVVFTGDTLFHGGCGRFFEGSAEEMHTALNKTLAALPDDTKVYVSHSCAEEKWLWANVCTSPATNTPSPTSSSPLLSHTQSPSRNYSISPRTTSRRRASSPLAMRSNITSS